MSTLFGNKIYSSISFKQSEILQAINHLHLGGRGIELDPTYGRGLFYDHNFPVPKYKYDLEPKVAGTTTADCRQLAMHPDRSIHSIMFDPPFVLSEHQQSQTTMMMKRFGGFKKIAELYEMYGESLEEISRVLLPGGKLVMKCQDMAHAMQNHFVHQWVMNYCENIGLKPVDLFILCSKNRFIGNTKNQRVARKFHSYFIVFRKRMRK
jgi:hypothetical protein